MVFSSYTFIFQFLPLTLLAFYWIPGIQNKLRVLLIASLVFYCYWSVPYSLLLLFTVCFDFFLAAKISATSNRKAQRTFLGLSLCTNLGILAFFKYGGLLTQTGNAFSETLMGHAIFPVIQVVLPIGISFYTFQSMSYLIDVYRGDARTHRDLLPFVSYVTMFPHQISGPLVRHDTIVPQLENPATFHWKSESVWKGVCFFVLGLSKKILIADQLASIVTPAVSTISHASNAEAFSAMLGYSMQLYFDFSGYSDMAVGLGYLLNIRFPQNFNSPYRATSITDFWRRWHITLSLWLRDYLYFSLGGNRKGKLRTYVNLMLTMVLGGIWHGASWTFAFWGFYHGCLLCFERVFKIEKAQAQWAKVLGTLVTFLLVCIGWTFFRSPDFATALVWLKKAFLLTDHWDWGLGHFAARDRDRFFAVLVIACLLSFFGKNTFQLKMQPNIRNAFLLSLLFALCLTFLREDSPFLYFQF